MQQPHFKIEDEDPFDEENQALDDDSEKLRQTGIFGDIPQRKLFEEEKTDSQPQDDDDHFTVTRIMPQANKSQKFDANMLSDDDEDTTIARMKTAKEPAMSFNPLA